MPVHLFGVPAALAPLHELAERHGLLLLEDAAQAHGALYRNRRVGSLGRAATFSFYPTKNLGAIGDGGAVVTDDAEIAETVRMLRAYGWRERSNSERHGFNSRLDELQAAFLRVKLRRLDGWNDRRRAVAARYAERLTVTGVRAVSPPSDVDPVWHLYVIATTSRDHLRSTLADAGIGTLVHYHPLPHLTPAFRADGWAEGSLPVAEQLAAEALSLPMFPQLTMQDCDSVVAAIEHATATARG
jgi:dTDP-4-amino-4,6-dideoxygalactose transaminase